MNIRKSSWAEISTGALKHNIAVMRSTLKPGTKICVILKGDAYGLGMTRVKQYMAENRLADMFACGTISEMITLFAETTDVSDLLLLGHCMAEELRAPLVDGRISYKSAVFSIWNMDQFRDFSKLAKEYGIKLRVHIRIDEWDSGMGLCHADYLKYENEIFNDPNIDVCGLYGHIYSSYDEGSAETKRELEAFDSLVKKINPAYRKRLTIHVQNSSLIFRYPEYSYDMARTGSALYGMPSMDNGKIMSVMKICGTIFSIRDVDNEVPLSYEAQNVTDGTRKIARVMIGYADCPLLLSQPDVQVLIKDRMFTLAEEACMDNLCIDITGNDDISVGDKVVILGKSGVNAEDIALRNSIDHVHCDWMLITAGRLEKVLVE